MARPAPISAGLEALLASRVLWRGRADPGDRSGLATGYPALDRALPGGGWPRRALTEVLVDTPGSGELALVTPALGAVARAGRWVVWVNPPHLPYAPALAAAGLPLERFLWVRGEDPDESLWVLEQALGSRACGAVLGWPAQGGERALRRLQLAAEAGECWGVLVRTPAAVRVPSPAALRLRVRPLPGAFEVRVLKCRGPLPAAPVRLPRWPDGEADGLP